MAAIVNTTSTSWSIATALFSASFVLSVVVSSVLVSTWIITSYRFRTEVQDAARPSMRAGKEPVTIPYALPWVGSSLGFLIDQGSFYDSIRKKFGRNISLYAMRLGPVRAYIISGASNINAVFKLSRHLSSDKFEEQILSGLGISLAEIKTLQEPAYVNIGSSDIASMGKKNRKFGLDHLYQDHLLSPEAVGFLTKKFINIFHATLEGAPEFLQTGEEEGKEEKERAATQGAAAADGGWVTLDLGGWIKHHMFEASTTALMGTTFLKLNPNLARDFWAFDKNFLKLAYGLPRLLVWEGYAAKDRLLDSAFKWLTEADAKGDIDSPEVWEPYYGSALIRGRQRLYKSAGLSVRSRGANEIGMLFGLSSNAIPATSWMLFNILSSPDDLLPRVLAELQTTIPGEAIRDGSDLVSQIHIPTLVALPLLQSLYTETLRLYVAVNVSREIKSDIEVDGHVLRAGNVLMAPTWLGHRNPDAWAAPGHPPASEFYAERFLVRGNEKEGEKMIFSMSGLAGRYFPYGGGAHICPGRFFAKQEILAAVALVLLRFEMHAEGWVDLAAPAVVVEQMGKGSRGAQVKTNYVGTGVMTADRDLRVRIRKR